MVGLYDYGPFNASTPLSTPISTQRRNCLVLKSAFGAHELQGALRLSYEWIVCISLTRTRDLDLSCLFRVNFVSTTVAVAALLRTTFGDA
jgi:hypothetical protein